MSKSSLYAALDREDNCVEYRLMLSKIEISVDPVV
jgi:hypothetical protein